MQMKAREREKDSIGPKRLGTKKESEVIMKSRQDGK